MKIDYLCFFFTLIVVLVNAKIFDRCEFGYELIDSGIKANNWNTEIPKSSHSSGLDTSYQNYGLCTPECSEDCQANPTNVTTYGILKIFEGNCGRVGTCSPRCEDLLGDNIAATVTCANIIFGDKESFEPWCPAWGNYCRDFDSSNFTKNCLRNLTIVTEELIVKLEAENNASIECSAQGYPRPRLNWTWVLTEDDDHISQEFNDTPNDIYYFATLSFSPVKISDNGRQFTCNAFNDKTDEREFVSKIFTIEVEQETSDPTTATTELYTTAETTTELIPETSTDASTLEASETPTTQSSSSEFSSSISTIFTTSGVSSSSSSNPFPTTTPSNAIIPTTPSSGEIIFTPCQLAMKLASNYDTVFTTLNDLEKWVCLSDVTTGLNTSYLQVDNTIVHYGLFKISNEWCSDVYNRDNPCGVTCDELFTHDLASSVSCSQFIYEQNGFSEWPEYNQESCPDDYIVPDCNQTLAFVFIDSETEVAFKEFSENKTLNCTVQGYPPPTLQWDLETMDYLTRSQGRLQSRTFKYQGEDGNLTIRHTIVFSKIEKEDERRYICTANNTVEQISLPFSVTVYSGGDELRWIITSSVFLGLLILVALISIYMIYRMRKKRNESIFKLYEDFKYGLTSLVNADSLYGENYLAIGNYQKVLQLPFPKSLEILPHQLEVNEKAILGSGAFGIVFEGLLDGKILVAVKTVPKDVDPSKLAALLSEVKIMSYVGRHPNIVSLLGVDIVDLKKGEILVAIEHCSRGSLEGVLHAKKRQLQLNESVISGYIYRIPGYVTNYAPKPFSRYQLLLFSHQVCCAMDFLVSKNIVHGDLASRNVLLDANFTAKISDFGLSRQIYDYKKYVLAAKDTALPWRWLALETLRDLKFSPASDCWAFGVFMWEVFSLADLPYSAGIQWSPEFITFLERGFRLQRPKYASDEIYKIMELCWQHEPQNRPTFQKLSILLLRLLETEHPNK